MTDDTRLQMSLPFFLAKWRMQTPQWGKEVLGEFMGTFILLVFGLATVAQVHLSKDKHGTFLTINLAWGLAVTMAAYWAGPMSGAHINPAVTLALASVKRFPLRKVPHYILTQLVATIVASAVVYAIYYDGINHFDGGKRQVLGEKGTAAIFSSYPKEFVSNVTGFWDQFFATAMLVAILFNIIDKENVSRPSPGLAPLIIGFIVALIGMTFGYNVGYPINPARDLGPRIFMVMAGWGTEVFTAHNNWAWIPPIACSFGGIAGAYLYIFMVELHRDKDVRVNEDHPIANIELDEQHQNEEHSPQELATF